MCGIIAAVAKRDVVPILLAGLQRLEYRGYDSAGLAVRCPDKGTLERQRVVGKVQKLIDVLENEPLSGTIGIAHTRWATHGVPNQINAHPHDSHQILMLVHNGIVENFISLRQELMNEHYEFVSQTDTEVVAHLLHHYQKTETLFIDALLRLNQSLQGAYALAIINNQAPDELWAIRKGSPLVIGIGIQENFLASDQIALFPVTNRFIHLEEGDIACITTNEIKIWNQAGEMVSRPETTSSLNHEMVSKGIYRHFMLKEIFEQPEALQRLLNHAFIQNELRPEPFGGKVSSLCKKAKQIYIIACGTSYHAGLVAKYWLEEIAGIPTYVEVASEFRYRHASIPADSLLITISQSGETADTLAAAKIAPLLHFIGHITICNIAESALARLADAVILTEAGPEIGVASTKAFTNQLLALLIMVLATAQERHRDIKELILPVLNLPFYTTQVLKLNEMLKHHAQQFCHTNHLLFLGRGINFPIAAEGALKLKELSYLHAEAYPAGELKHGPLALIDSNMPCLLLAPSNKMIEKIYSNAQEIKTRDGKLFILTDEVSRFSEVGEVLTMPTIPEIIVPIIYTLPLQLLAYHVAVLKGTDVDQPRNLAKSVTVE